MGKSTFLIAVLVGALSGLLTESSSGVPLADRIERARDPWVFRLILENKSRMVVAALSEDLWVAYNPRTGGLFRAWSGGISFQGKVWDFSQNNSRTEGTAYHTQRSEILAEDSLVAQRALWAGDGVEFVEEGSVAVARFRSDLATLTSPVLDLTGFVDVTLTFEERSRRGSFLVQISEDRGTTWDRQVFYSTKHGSQQTHWQQNLKRLVAGGSQVRFRFVQTVARHEKALRKVRVDGDARVWRARRGGQGTDLEVDWRGYRVLRETESVTFRWDLVDEGGRRIHIEESPERDPEGIGLARRFSVLGVREGEEIVLRLDGAGWEEAWSVEGAGRLERSEAATELVFDRDGRCVVRTHWTEAGS